MNTNGVTVTFTEENFKIYSSSKDSQDKPSLIQIHHDKNYNKAVILIGNIHYRNEGIWESFANKNDNYLQGISDIYQEYGREGVQKIEGEYSLIILDGKQKELIAFRDKLGSYPFFWTRNQHSFVISTSLRYLATNVLEKTVIDETYLAHYIMNLHDAELQIVNTPFVGINRVLPSHFLCVNQENIIHQCYWSWEDNIIDNSQITLEESSEEIRYRVNNALRERMIGNTSCHFSGGMDSTSLAILAAQNLENQELKNPLQTISCFYQQYQKMAEEYQYIKHGQKALPKSNANIIITEINADDSLDFNNIDEPILHDEPRNFKFRIGMVLLTIFAAIDFNSSTLITGTNAEPILEGNRVYIADLVRQGKLLEAYHHLTLFAKAKTSSFQRILLESVLKPLFPLLVESGGNLNRYFSGYGSLTSIGTHSISPWVKRDFARKYGLRQIGRNNAQILNQSPSDVTMYISCLRRLPHWLSWDYCLPYNLHITNPYADPRLISYCVGIPNRIKSLPDKRKILLQTAMKDILPDEIRNRRYKGDFNSIYYKGLNRNLPRLQQIVANSSLAENGIFDFDLLTNVMLETALGKHNIHICDRLNSTLALISWFDR